MERFFLFFFLMWNTNTKLLSIPITTWVDLEAGVVIQVATLDK